MSGRFISFDKNDLPSKHDLEETIKRLRSDIAILSEWKSGKNTVDHRALSRTLGFLEMMLIKEGSRLKKHIEDVEEVINPH